MPNLVAPEVIELKKSIEKRPAYFKTMTYLIVRKKDLVGSKFDCVTE